MTQSGICMPICGNTLKSRPHIQFFVGLVVCCFGRVCGVCHGYMIFSFCFLTFEIGASLIFGIA